MRSWILPSIFGVSWIEWLGLPVPGEAALVSAGVVEGQHLERVLGGDPVTEAMVIRFIGHRWGAPSLCELPAKVATEALRRPADFIRAAKEHCEPELPF